MSVEKDLVELARAVVVTARTLNVSLAVIGAAAMAKHGYVRATLDIDFAARVSLADLRKLRRALEEAGMNVQLREPDDGDPLAGCIDVMLPGIGIDADADEDQEQDEKIQIVNFSTSKRGPGARAIKGAEEVGGLPVVKLADLVALKLYAGSPRDIDDVKRLLDARPDADRDEIRAACAESGLEDALKLVLD